MGNAKKSISLFLDVYVPPNTKTTSGLPVKVFIYGGAESSGGISDPLYNGCNLAKAGTVFVTINYRLGTLGFLALESAGIAGNFGIQDILLGLQWVQDNIAAFGGDPVSGALQLLESMMLTQSRRIKYSFLVNPLAQSTFTTSPLCHRHRLSSKQPFPSLGEAETLHLEAQPTPWV